MATLVEVHKVNMDVTPPPPPKKGFRRMYITTSFACGKEIPGYWQMAKVKYPLQVRGAYDAEIDWNPDIEDYVFTEYTMKYPTDRHIKQQLQIQRQDLEKKRKPANACTIKVDERDHECDDDWQLL